MSKLKTQNYNSNIKTNMEPHGQSPWFQSRRPDGANIPYQKTNSSTYLNMPARIDASIASAAGQFLAGGFLGTGIKPRAYSFSLLVINRSYAVVNHLHCHSALDAESIKIDIDSCFHRNDKENAVSVRNSCIKFVSRLPNNRIYWVIGDQLLRAVISIGANIVEAKSSSSKREFIKYY